MDYRVVFKEKLSKMIFLEIDKNGFKDTVCNGAKINFKNKELYLPIDIDYISNNIKDNSKLSNIPVYKFIEGMFYALGCDKDFKYNDDYKSLINNIDNSKDIIKRIIADKIKESKYDDAFVLLKGLTEVEKEIEYYEKILMIGEYIREKDSSFKEIQKEVIEECKKEFPNYPMPYFYNAIILREEDEIYKAFIEMNEYLNKGGEKTDNFISIYEELKDGVDYEKGKEALEEDKPKEALEKLLPLMDKYGDNPLLYLHIAVAYRKLNNSEKAIYYLNESLALDSAYVETVNELALNLAMLGNYEEAIKYFKKAFEATKSVEICTNLIMCYINLNKIEDAKKHLKIAEKLDSKDEVVIKLKEILG